MKFLFALMILMIGLLVMPPGPVGAKSIDHGISLVCDVGQQAPAAISQEIVVGNYQVLLLENYKEHKEFKNSKDFKMVMLAEKHEYDLKPKWIINSKARLCEQNSLYLSENYQSYDAAKNGQIKIRHDATC